MALTKVNIIGQKYYHRFFNKDTNEYFETETTQADYEQLGQSNPTNPTTAKPGFEWEFSGKRLKFDTTSGDIEDDQYAVVTQYMVKEKGKWETQVDEDMFDGSKKELKSEVIKKDETVTKIKESDAPDTLPKKDVDEGR